MRGILVKVREIYEIQKDVNNKVIVYIIVSNSPVNVGLLVLEII